MLAEFLMMVMRTKENRLLLHCLSPSLVFFYREKEEQQKKPGSGSSSSSSSRKNKNKKKKNRQRCVAGQTRCCILRKKVRARNVMR